MNRGSRSFLQVIFAFFVALVAALAAVAVTTIFHLKSKFVSGVTYLVATAALLYLIERTFPTVYHPRRYPKHLWEIRGVVAVAAAIVYTILSSAVASIWFGSVIVSGALVALFLHFRSAERPPTQND